MSVKWPTKKEAEQRAVNIDGTVINRPDETWRFVVEVPEDTSKWPALADEHPQRDPQWVYVATFDSQEEAVNYAQAHDGPARVRSYKQQHMPQDYGIHPDVFTSKPISGPEVPLVTYECIDHADEHIAVPQSAKAPRCPRCHSGMVLPAFAAKVRAL